MWVTGAEAKGGSGAEREVEACHRPWQESDSILHLTVSRLPNPPDDGSETR